MKNAEHKKVFVLHQSDNLIRILNSIFRRRGEREDKKKRICEGYGRENYNPDDVHTHNMDFSITTFLLFVMMAIISTRTRKDRTRRQIIFIL